MTTDKGALRTAALARRDGLNEATQRDFATRIATLGPRLVHEFAPATANLVVALYAAIGSEPDMMPLARALREADVETALPVTGSRSHPLVFRRWGFGDPTSAGRLRIEEPLAYAPVVEPDLLFVPLSAFDRRGHRIGYGAGNYDRTLARLRNRKAIRAIGVAFAEQEVLFVPSEPHDEPLDVILTERDIVLCAR